MDARNKTKTTFERFQYEAARIVTGLTRSTSIANLYRECGWDSIAKRRQFQKMCFMYKCSNDLVPDYISGIIPPLVGEVTNYSLRNRQNLANVYTRIEVSRRSCIPSSVSSWNSLSNDMRETDTYLSFRNADNLLLFQVVQQFIKDTRRF